MLSPAQHYSLSALITAITATILAALVFSRAANRRLARYFCWYTFTIAHWSFFVFACTSVRSQDLSYLLCQICHAVGVFIPIAFLQFVQVYTDNKLSIVRGIVALGYLIVGGISVSIVIYPKLFIPAVVSKLTFNFFPEPGPLFIVWNAAFVILVLAGVGVLFVEAQKKKGLERKNLIAFLIANSLGYLGGIGCFFPVYNLAVFPFPYGIWGVFFFSCVTAYAVLRYKFLDIEVIIKKTLVFTGLFATAMVIVSVITTVAQSYIGQTARFSPIVSTALSVFIAILLYDPVRRFLERLTENVLFQQDIDYEKIEEDVSNSIKITDLDKLCQSLVDIFYEEMKFTHVILFLYDEEKKEFRIGAARGIDRENWLALKDSDSWVQELRKGDTETVYLKANLEDGQRRLFKGLNAVHSEAFAKVVFESRLIALLVLGKKKSDEDFTTRDQQLLLKAANQMAVSISHATTFRLQRDYYVLQAQRNKSDALSNLSAGLAHEVSNPLNMIRPRIELLIEACASKTLRPDDPKVMDNLQTQLKHVDRIMKIMNRLNHFARPIEGKDIKLGPVSLKPFVEEAIGLIGEKQLDNDNIKVKVHIPDDLSPVYAEETSLIQVFYNLITNAHHAINRNGMIRIEARDIPQDGRVLVKIEDTGKGIPLENLEKIFEPFFTTKPTNLPQDGSEHFTGSGLGLAFVKKYMEDLGGTVTVTSQVGKGTTFYLKFLRSAG